MPFPTIADPRFALPRIPISAAVVVPRL